MSRGSRDYGLLSCQVVKMTGKAVLVRTGDKLENFENHWIPFSLIDEEDLSDMEPGKKYEELHVEEWFMEREMIE